MLVEGKLRKMIYIASDHAGFKLKEKLKKKIAMEDLSLDYVKEDDYPDYAKRLCKMVLKTKGSGILICGTGIGMSIAANKFKGIRAGVCWNKTSARFAKSHNAINVLCIPARLINEKEAMIVVNTWLKTKVSDAKRHKRRINKIKGVGGCGK